MLCVRTLELLDLDARTIEDQISDYIYQWHGTTELYATEKPFESINTR